MGNSLINPLLQIPYIEGGRTEEGCDCWGLVILYYQKAYGMDLPRYEDIYYQSTANYEVTVDSIEVEKAKQGLFEEVPEPKRGDVILVNMLGRPLHMGIVLNSQQMIHANRKTGVTIEDYTGIKWKRRIMGFYRLTK